MTLTVNSFLGNLHFRKAHIIICIIYLVLGLADPQSIFAQISDKTLTPKMLSMPRSRMYLEDDQLLLFNGIGLVSPCQLSITGFTNIKFPPVELPKYNFHFDFFDNLSGQLIFDDTKYLEDLWLEKSIGEAEPNGANFRPGNLKMIVPQEDVWQPNQSYRKGIFHQKFGQNWLSLGIESWTSVSGKADEVLMKIRVVNRASEVLDITLIPTQEISRTISAMKGIPVVKEGVFELSSGQTNICVAADISRSDAKGFGIKLPAHGTGEYYFAIQVLDTSKKILVPARYQTDIKERFMSAYQRTCDRLQFTADHLPSIKTENKQINELYKRCLLTVSECKWERDNFILKPFWASGGWIISMIWDQCFAEEVLAMIDPKGLKESIKLTLRECEMKRSYIFWSGAGKGDGILYIQDPFAIQTMIDAYITYTGDKSIMDEKTGDATVYEWMKRWIYELHDKYSRPDGLVDVVDPEHLIEIRTAGYDRVVPVVCGLTASFYQRMSEWAFERGDNDAAKFKLWSEQIRESFTKKLWNDQLGWFDNLYPDGGKGTTMTFHLFDLLETDIISSYQKSRMMEHLVDGEFLAPYGLYSISKTDTLHFDQIDADFGGGGQYMGMTLRIANNLFENGEQEKGLMILERFSKYTDHFPYLTGNPWSDKMYQNRVSLCLHIAAGAGIEAINSGIFGVRPHENGSIEINPFYHIDLGNSELTGFGFRGNTYDVILKSDYYSVKKNGKVIAKNKYGKKLVIQPD